MSKPLSALRRAASRTASFAAVVLVSAALGEGFLYALRHIPAIARIPALSPLAEEIYLTDREIVTLLPHYGGESFVVFQGRTAEDRGLLPAGSSPLDVDLTLRDRQ